MIEKIQVIDMIEVVGGGHVQVRTRVSVVEDGKEIGSSLHRHVIAPGDDYNGEDAKVQAICAAMHTPEVINEYKAAIAAQGV